MSPKTASLFLLSIVGCANVSGFAATCSTTLGPLSMGGNYVGSDCGNNPGFNGAATLCGGVSYSNTGTDIWALNLGAAQDFSFTVSSSVFTPDIALLSGACADNSPCVNGTDYSTGTGTVSSATIVGQPAGTYYLVVTDSTAAGAQCGAYNLTFSAPLPVLLQEFSVR